MSANPKQDHHHSCCELPTTSENPSASPHEHHHHSSSKSGLVSVAVAFGLAIVSMATGMPHYWGGHPSTLTASISFVSALILIVLFGRHFLRDLPKVFYHANMNTLVGLGIVASFGLSFWNWSRGNLHDIYFDSAAFIAAFVLLGQWVERLIQQKMNAQLSHLVSLLPQKAHRLSGQQGEELVDLSSLRVGDRIRVLMGERVPADSKIVTSADSSFDLSVITGESKPVTFKIGGEVVQGAVNLGQPLEMEVVRASKDSLYEKIVQNVKKTLSERPRIQKKVDRISAIFVPFVVVLAVGTAVFWRHHLPASPVFIITSISVLVAACPCALGIATPSALLVGVLKASRHGILFRSLDAAEKATEITSIAFDKTGTLTFGKPAVQQMKAIENFSHRDLLQLAYSVEVTSEHPYARAINERAQSEKIKTLPSKNLQVVAGKGVIGDVDRDGKWQRVCVGNLLWLIENGYDSTKVPPDLQWEAEGSSDTVLWVGADQTYLGVMTLADEIRPAARDVSQQLSNEGYEVGMITGDAENVAKSVAKALKLKFFHFGVLPEEKATLVRRLSEPKKKGLDMIVQKVAFIGDGVNDAPAIAEAHLGIAMGAGAAISQTSADMILLSNDLKQVDSVFKILRETRSLIRQNLFLGFAYNILILPIAAGVLYPKWGFLLNPALAALAMAASSVTVLFNSLRHSRD